MIAASPAPTAALDVRVQVLTPSTADADRFGITIGARTVTVAAGDLEARLSVPTTGDVLDEADGTVRLALRDDPGLVTRYRQGSSVLASVGIADDDVVPDAPSQQTPAPGDGTVTVSWIKPADGTSPITGYTVEYDDDTNFGADTGDPGWPRSVTTDQTSVEVTGLTNGTTYHFRVFAASDAGTSVPSAVMSAAPLTVPGKPAAPSLEPATGQLTVTWTAPSTDGGAEITAYEVRHKLSTAPESAWTAVRAWNTGDGALTEIIDSLVDDSEYDVAVRAVNSAGEGPWSDAAKGTPGVANRPPAFDAPSYGFSLAENADGSTSPVAVGTVSATDPDSGDTVTYSITAGNTGAEFAIDSSSGAITYVGSGEDYESFADAAAAAAAFSLTVTAADDHSAAVTVTVTVGVTDVYDPATTASGVAVAEGSVLVPAGLGVGDRFRVLFVTSTTTSTTSPDIGDYNGHVQGRAAAGHAAIRGFSSEFRAVASTSAVDAIDKHGHDPFRRDARCADLLADRRQGRRRLRRLLRQHLGLPGGEGGVRAPAYQFGRGGDRQRPRAAAGTRARCSAPAVARCGTARSAPGRARCRTVVLAVPRGSSSTACRRCWRWFRW